MNASYILDNLPSLCQKLSHLVDVWRNYNKNNFACFFETQCIVFALEHLRLLTRGIMSEIGQVTWACKGNEIILSHCPSKMLCAVLDVFVTTGRSYMHGVVNC